MLGALASASQSNYSWPESPVDYSCSSAVDCQAKDVGNCCGSYVACVNAQYPADKDAMFQWCIDNEIRSTCTGSGGGGAMYCICEEGKCKGTGPGGPGGPGMPPVNMTDWTLTRAAIVAFEVLLVALLLARPRSCSTLLWACTATTFRRFFAGLALGSMWIHYLPCFWSLCDAGLAPSYSVRFWALLGGMALGCFGCCCLTDPKLAAPMVGPSRNPDAGMPLAVRAQPQ